MYLCVPCYCHACEIYWVACGSEDVIQYNLQGHAYSPVTIPCLAYDSVSKTYFGTIGWINLYAQQTTQHRRTTNNTSQHRCTANNISQHRRTANNISQHRRTVNNTSQHRRPNIMNRPVARGGAGGLGPLEKFRPSWKNVLDIVWNYWT